MNVALPWTGWRTYGIYLVIFAGCGAGTDRRALEGTVTIDGEPLAEGDIAFLSRRGTSGPTAGGNNCCWPILNTCRAGKLRRIVSR